MTDRTREADVAAIVNAVCIVGIIALSLTAAVFRMSACAETQSRVQLCLTMKPEARPPDCSLLLKP